MTAQLNYIIARQRIADLQRDARRTRLARDIAESRTPTHHRPPIARLTARLLTARA